MTPMQLAFYYMFCLLTGVIAGWGVTAYARRRQKVKSCSVSIDHALVTSSDFRRAWAGVDSPGPSPRTMTEMETLLINRKPHKPPYETPMYRPDLGVIPGGRIVESVTFAERGELAAARKAPVRTPDFIWTGQIYTDAMFEKDCHTIAGKQTTLWDIIPAPADLQKSAVG